MTREEFSEIDSLWELQDFCEEIECPVTSSWYTESERDNYINEEQLIDWAHNYTWSELKDILDNIGNGDDFYILNNYGEWEGVDEYYIDQYKEDVILWIDERGLEDVFEREYDEEDDDSFDAVDNDDDFRANSLLIAKYVNSCLLEQTEVTNEVELI